MRDNYITSRVGTNITTWKKMKMNCFLRKAEKKKQIWIKKNVDVTQLLLSSFISQKKFQNRTKTKNITKEAKIQRDLKMKIIWSHGVV